jgi:hypothetical protein
MVDTEVFWVDLGSGEMTGWLYHQESRVPDEQAAAALAEKMRAWLDRMSPQALNGLPGAGPLAMSKAPKLEGRAWYALEGLMLRSVE